ARAPGSLRRRRQVQSLFEPVYRIILSVSFGMGVACAPAASAPPVGIPPGAPPADEVATPIVAEGLPPIPLVEGPLTIDVVHPTPGTMRPGSESVLVYGSVGSGRATLTINGTPVGVHPNGAFLGFL